MLEATCGVNTHKGSLFALGLLTACAAQTRAVEGSLESAKVLLRVSRVAEGIVERELEACTRLATAGERLYKTYGIKGIRGEAEHGFPSVRLEGLPALNEAFSAGLPLSESLRHALVRIMAYAEDTTVIHRGGLACFQQMQRLAREVCEKGGMLTEWGRSAYERLCRFCLETRISPGGSADLLACTIACYLWDNHHFPVEVK